MRFAYYGRQYDRSTGNWAFYGTITNTSALPLSSPIRLLWTDIVPPSAFAVHADGGPGSVPGKTLPPASALVDVDGDGIVTPHDLLQVINALNDGPPFGGEGEAALQPAPTASAWSIAEADLDRYFASLAAEDLALLETRVEGLGPCHLG